MPPEQKFSLQRQKVLRSEEQQCEINRRKTAGEKLHVLVKGKSKNPRYFKNIKSLECSYKAQKKKKKVLAGYSDI